jgi:transcriptional regulator with XRE-family HTH domain
VTEDATARRRQLGVELRHARTAVGLTQSEVADSLGVSQAKINKIERTLMSIRSSELDQLIRLYEIPAERAALLVELARLDSQEALGRTSWSAYHSLIEIEENSEKILSWHSERIPYILQAEYYAFLQAEAAGVKEADIAGLLRRRMKRQQIFDGADPPSYEAILSESSLRRMPIGRSAVAIDQCAHLLGLMERYEHVSVRILEFKADIPYVDSDFVLLYPKDAGGEAVAYVEYVGDSRLVQKRRDINMMREFWDRLHKAALSREDSIEYLRVFKA